MEDLTLDFAELEDLEEIQNCLCRFNFPVVRLGNTRAIFNKHCAPLMKDSVRWFVSSDYVIGVPAPRGGRNTFNVRLHFGKDGQQTFADAHFPAMLRKEKKVAAGYYKILKFRDGFAFKRYEPMTVN